MSYSVLNAPQLQTLELNYTYATKPLFHSPIDISLNAGEWLHVLGENGAGKSTFLKLLIGLIRTQKGKVLWEGTPITECLTQYHQQLCYVGHANGFNPAMLLEENLRLDWHWDEANKTALNEGLKAFSLNPSIRMPLGHLSAGQQRKAALLRLWMTRAKLWVLDEPLVTLDKQSLEVLMQLCEQHLKQGGMLVLSSHQPVALAGGKQVRLK